MLGYALIIVCGLLVTVQAMAGFVVTAHPPTRALPRHSLRLLFACFAATGLIVLGWASLRAWQSHRYRPGIVDIELSADQSEAQLQRIATLLGVNTDQDAPALADAIVERLPSPVWHMPVVQRDAFGLALDQVRTADRFPVTVRSIPSNANSIAFSDDVLQTLRAHGWTARPVRDFGISNEIPGVLIAVSPTVKSKDEVPLAAKQMIAMLEKAGITPYGAPLPEVGAGDFELVIGKGPK